MDIKGHISWGILGTGKIAGVFAKGLQTARLGKLLGVGSRSMESATRFAAEWGAPKRYASYDALLADRDIDAIYISLPNHLHKEWIIRCAQAGKHILCEKPLATNYAEAKEAIDAVRAQDVFLMEAFMYRCHPQTARLVQLIRDGAIGKVRVIQAHFSYNMGGLQKNIRQENQSAGGAIMDVGCYCVSYARLVAGAALGQDFADPVAVKAVAHLGEETRVDEWATAALRFPGDILANVTCGIQVRVDYALRIWGSEGHIIVPNPWLPGQPRHDSDGVASIRIQRDGEAQPKVETLPMGDPLYSIEADTVARHIKNRQAPSPCMTWADSLGNMNTLDAWRKDIGLVFDNER